MEFAQGRFAGAGDTYYYVIRFDKNLKAISGEIYSLGLLPDPPDHLSDPTIEPLGQLSTWVNLLRPDGTRDASFTVSAGGNVLTLTGGGRTLTFTKVSETRLTLDYKSNPFGISEFTDQATLDRTSPEVFRVIDLQVDRTNGTQPLGSFTLGGRTVTFEECMLQAGVRVRLTETQFGDDKLLGWNDTELHNALNTRMTGFDPQVPSRGWKAYMLVCGQYGPDAAVRGYMFDGAGRRGSAVFFGALAQGLSGETLQKRYIRTAIHELCHTLNLLHTFDTGNDSFFGVNALSFMNYPDEFPGGSDAYWATFQFLFDVGEKAALRHAPINQLIIGGDPFRGHQPKDAPRLDAPLRTDVSLTLHVRPRRSTPATFEFGEPVLLEAKLSLPEGASSGAIVRDALDPAYGVTTYTIVKPNGDTVVFRPVMQLCADETEVKLHPRKQQSITAPVFLGYGAAGFPFMSPGLYAVSAVHRTPTGIVRSRPFRLWVRYPDRATEDLIVPTFEDDFGRFLALKGGPHLAKAHEVYHNALSASGHPLAMMFRALNTTQKAQGFKRLELKTKTVKTDPIQVDRLSFEELLGLGPEAGRPIRLPHNVLGRLGATFWTCLRADGEQKAATKVKSHVANLLRSRGVKERTIRHLSKMLFKPE